ncbi:MAG: hypothetical protein OXR62_15095 [Ahrensia sp.]|nr:hypothetical protein [Ahrensia sp.]
MGGIKWPRWVVVTLVLATIFNVFVALSWVMTYWAGNMPANKIAPENLYALHFQLFEIILATLAVGLGVFGFVGYGAIQVSAEKRAVEVAKDVAERAYEVERAKREAHAESTQEPDLQGLDRGNVKRQKEGGEL